MFSFQFGLSGSKASFTPFVDPRVYQTSPSEGDSDSAAGEKTLIKTSPPSIAQFRLNSRPSSAVRQRAAETGAGPTQRSQEDLCGQRQPDQHQASQRHARNPQIQEALQLRDPVRRAMG